MPSDPTPLDSSTRRPAAGDPLAGLEHVPDERLVPLLELLVDDAATHGLPDDPAAGRAVLAVAVVTVAAGALAAVVATAAVAFAAAAAVAAVWACVGGQVRRRVADVRAHRVAVAELAAGLVTATSVRHAIEVLAADDGLRRGPLGVLTAAVHAEIDAAGCTGGHSTVCRHRRFGPT